MNNLKSPVCYLLVGVPGSGKSTWIQAQPFDWTKTVVASTDNFVEAVARKAGKTYSEVFRETMPLAVKHMAEVVTDAVNHSLDLIWDQTSTTVHARAKKFRMLPENYTIVGVVFPTPDAQELARRLASRPGKIIPPVVMNQMISQWEEPTMREGFDRIIHVG